MVLTVKYESEAKAAEVEEDPEQEGETEEEEGVSVGDPPHKPLPRHNTNQDLPILQKSNKQIRLLRRPRPITLGKPKTPRQKHVNTTILRAGH